MNPFATSREESVFLDFIEDIKEREGWRPNPYRCPKGHLTIGYGINLDVGITKEQGELLLLCKATEVYLEVEKKLPVFKRLSPARRGVLLDMAYNVGVGGLLKFKNMIHALILADYNLAADEMLNSQWHRDFTKWADGDVLRTRSYQLSVIMREG